MTSTRAQVAVRLAAAATAVRPSSTSNASRPAQTSLPPTLRASSIEGINLVALGKLRFAVGEAILVGTGPCAPCGKLDELIGPGAFHAVRGHGGITARIERGGRIRLGDEVRVLPADGRAA